MTRSDHEEVEQVLAEMMAAAVHPPMCRPQQRHRVTDEAGGLSPQTDRPQFCLRLSQSLPASLPATAKTYI
jgi:hypothetical protein